MGSTLRTWVLMAGLTAFLVLVGDALAGSGGALLFFLIALGMNGFSFWFSDTVAIRAAHARPLEEDEAPELHRTLARLSRNAGIPTPRLYISPNPQPNAFATGRNPNHAAVCVTEGLLRELPPDEVEGVLAHELAHIRHRDILLASMAATIAGAITMIANMAQWSLFFGGLSRDDEGRNPFAQLILIMLAPLAAAIIQMAISRQREFKADEGGARIAGSPDGLANALLRLEALAQRRPVAVNPATSHLYIVKPFSGSGLASLFSTHPPIEERVRRLREMRPLFR